MMVHFHRVYRFARRALFLRMHRVYKSVCKDSTEMQSLKHTLKIKIKPTVRREDFQKTHAKINRLVHDLNIVS